MLVEAHGGELLYLFFHGVRLSGSGGSFSTENIAHLAESALRFLELVQENHVNTEQDVSGEEAEETLLLHPSDNYDSGRSCCYW